MNKSPLLLGISALALSAPCAPGANVIVDGGFESGNNLLVNESPPFNSGWHGVTGPDTTSTSEITGDSPRSGAFSLDLSTSSNDGFTGAFQQFDVSGLIGTTITFSGWHQLVGEAGGSQYRIELFDDMGSLTSRVQGSDSPTPGGDYERFTISETVSNGTVNARVTYIAQSIFSGVVNQNIFVDDTSFDVVPEPSSVALLGLSALGLITRRRR